MKDYKYDKGKPIAGALADFAHAFKSIDVAVAEKYTTKALTAVVRDSSRQHINNLIWFKLQDKQFELAALYAMIRVEIRLVATSDIVPLVQEYEYVLDFAKTLLELSELLTLGAAKYKRSSWRTVQDGMTRYFDATYRHILWSRIENIDPELNMDHDVCVLFNCLALLEFKHNKTLGHVAHDLTTTHTFDHGDENESQDNSESTESKS